MELELRQQTHILTLTQHLLNKIKKMKKTRNNNIKIMEQPINRHCMVNQKIIPKVDLKIGHHIWVCHLMMMNFMRMKYTCNIP